MASACRHHAREKWLGVESGRYAPPRPAQRALPAIGRDQWNALSPRNSLAATRPRVNSGAVGELADLVTLVVQVDEAHMVATFLRAEVDSPRHGAKLGAAALRLGLDLRVVRSPDTTSDLENRDRIRLLAEYRGWGAYESVFGGLPTDSIEWWSAELDRDGIREVEVIQWLVDEYPDSFPARPLAEICAATGGAWADDDGRLQRRLEEGRALVAPILISAPDMDRLVILEGHNRMVGYARLGAAAPRAIDIIVGITPRASEWSEW
jgi:hypothetical protein